MNVRVTRSWLHGGLGALALAVAAGYSAGCLGIAGNFDVADSTSPVDGPVDGSVDGSVARGRDASDKDVTARNDASLLGDDTPDAVTDLPDSDMFDVEAPDAGSPVCSPGATQCSGNGVRTCTPAGQFGDTMACDAGYCNQGQCGLCASGSMGCVDGGTETCTPDGQLGPTTPCTNQACVSGVCTGACAPGAAQPCFSTSALQTCSASGVVGSMACPGGYCSSGACGTCPSPQHLCGTSCAPNDATACGAGCIACAAPTTSCNGTSCVCPIAGYTVCGGACVNLAADPANCLNCGQICASGTCTATGCAPVVVDSGAPPADAGPVMNDSGH